MRKTRPGGRRRETGGGAAGPRPQRGGDSWLEGGSAEPKGPARAGAARPHAASAAGGSHGPARAGAARRAGPGGWMPGTAAAKRGMPAGAPGAVCKAQSAARSDGRILAAGRGTLRSGPTPAGRGAEVEAAGWRPEAGRGRGVRPGGNQEPGAGRVCCGAPGIRPPEEPEDASVHSAAACPEPEGTREARRAECKSGPLRPSPARCPQSGCGRPQPAARIRPAATGRRRPAADRGAWRGQRTAARSFPARPPVEAARRDGNRLRAPCGRGNRRPQPDGCDQRARPAARWRVAAVKPAPAVAAAGAPVEPSGRREGAAHRGFRRGNCTRSVSAGPDRARRGERRARRPRAPAALPAGRRRPYDQGTRRSRAKGSS